MITLKFNSRSVSIDKSSDVKYIAKLVNFDKRFVFARQFINDSTLSTHDNSFILEVVSKDKKTKKYYIVDSKSQKVEECTYENIKKISNENMGEFGSKYFF